MNKLVCFVVVVAVINLMASCSPAATPAPTQTVMPSTPTPGVLEVTQGPPTAVLSTATPKPTATSRPEEKTPTGQAELKTVTLKVSGFT